MAHAVLFFVSASREMWVARYEPEAGFRVVGRELFFDIPLEIRNLNPGIGATNYDISSDARRFLMVRPYREGAEIFYQGLVVVRNWTEELKELVTN